MDAPFEHNPNITILETAEFPHPADNYLLMVRGTFKKPTKIEHVTWVYNTEFFSLASGHYFDDEEKAKKDFKERVEKLLN